MSPRRALAIGEGGATIGAALRDSKLWRRDLKNTGGLKRPALGMHQPKSTGGLKRPRDENVQRWGRTVSPCRDLAIKEGGDAIGEIPNRGVEI